MVADREVNLPFRGVEREVELDHADLAVAFDGGADMFQGFLNEMVKLHMVFLSLVSAGGWRSTWRREVETFVNIHPSRAHIKAFNQAQALS